MTAAKKLYQLIQTLPESQINEVLHFAEFLQQKQLTTPQSIPRDIALEQVRQLIEKTPGVVGGDACIRGTRIPVWELVEYRQLGASTSKILEAYPQLTELDLQTAWDYDRSFPEEIAAAIAANKVA